MKRISIVLKEKGLSQAKLARMADVNQTSMSRIVNGKEPPYSKRGPRIAAALGWEGNWQDLFVEVADDAQQDSEQESTEGDAND